MIDSEIKLTNRQFGSDVNGSGDESRPVRRSLCRKRNRNGRKRFGVAATELAIVIPFILLIIGSSIEICSAIFLKESLTVAAYEGGRVAVQRKGDAEKASARIRQVLEERGVDIEGFSNAILFEPQPEEADVLQPISIRVRAKISKNNLIPFSWLAYATENNIEAKIVMRKEFKNPPPPEEEE